MSRNKGGNSSESSKISSQHMRSILDSLKGKGVRDTTNQNYLAVWRIFNKFLIRLDRRPDNWEERTLLFCAHLINSGSQSQTIKSYISAIKSILKVDGYEWDEAKALFSSLTRACKIHNDKLRVRLPIRRNLLEILLFELKRILTGQFYLQILYRAMFCMAYYGLMRVGEITQSNHALKAVNVHTGRNKNKILLILYTSKTHGKDQYPQEIKISAANKGINKEIFCPFEAITLYMELRGGIKEGSENFFIFRDRSAVKSENLRKILKSCLRNLNLNEDLYNTHSFRLGRTFDLKREGYSLELLKRVGRWRSNAVFRYIRE